MRGPSLDRETLRDEPMPDAEEDSERRDVEGVEEAREASSRESRRGCEDGGLRFAYPARDIANILGED